MKLPFLHELDHWVETQAEASGFYATGWSLMIGYVLLVLFYGLFELDQTLIGLTWLIALSPVWLPILLVRFAIFSWVKWRRATWSAREKWVLCEIKIPENNLKGPLAMEAFFNAIYIGAGESTWYKRYLWGRTRDWTSFEIASIEGKIHFYFYTRVRYRRLIESALYAQYPDIEIIEAEDYSRLRDPSHAPYNMFACEYVHQRPDPYPIRTYVEWGLDRPGLKPEEYVDPLGNLLELLGSLGPGEQSWLQIIIRNAKREKFKEKWGGAGKALVAKIQKEASKMIGPSGVYAPSPGQLAQMDAIERNVGKPGFDVGIRSIYSAPPEKYYPMMQAFTANLMRVFESERYNNLVPAALWSEKFNDYPWEDIGGKRMRREMHEVLQFYRRREYFHPPYRGPFMGMSSEELATIFHIPTKYVTAPGVVRIHSDRSRPPLNLPT